MGASMDLNIIGHMIILIDFMAGVKPILLK